MHSIPRSWLQPANRCGRNSSACICNRRVCRSWRMSNGEFYPTGPDVVPQMLELLAKQVASPVQFVKGLKHSYEAGARMFVEVGPKKALQGFRRGRARRSRRCAFRSSPIIPKLVTSHPSTRRSADCTPRDSAAARVERHPSVETRADPCRQCRRRTRRRHSPLWLLPALRPTPRQTENTKLNSGSSSPRFWNAAGRLPGWKTAHRKRPGRDHRRGAGPARNRSHLRRRQRRAHPARRAVHRSDPHALPPARCSTSTSRAW